MKRSWICSALLALSVQAAHADPAGATTDVDAMWTRFLEGGDYAATIAAYDVLEKIGYDGNQVDAAKCESASDALRAAIEEVPVSLALRRAAYLCADAGKDAAATDRALEVLAALSRQALKQAGDAAVARPIRIVAPADAYALLLGVGMEEKYEYYLFTHQARYFPLVMVGWDAESGTERHFSFDYVDSLHRLRPEKPDYRNMPVMRSWIVNAFVDTGRALAAVDASAVRAAGAMDAVPDQVAKLRGAATAGGVQAARYWLELCAGKNAPKDCSVGLVDTLLDQAERKNAWSMVLLAFAYADGVGTKADLTAAGTLLDAAERRWPGFAVPMFAGLWNTAHGDAKLPVPLRGRIQTAQAAAAPAMQRLRVLQQVQAAKPHLSADDIAFLSDSSQNGRGVGYALLVTYFSRLGQHDEAWKWTKLAAEAGDPDAQGWLASALIHGDQKQVAKDAVKGRLYAQEAAQGGDHWAARWLSNQEFLAGNFQAAEGWLLDSAGQGNIDSLMRLAGLYAAGKPQVSGDAKRAAELYRMLSDLGEQGAPARRALADMAIEGIGMPKDLAQARALLMADAEKGDSSSQAVLGGYYLEGSFGKVDEAEGARWLQRAIKAGEENAVTMYGSWLYYKKNTPQSRQQALSMLAQADAQGNLGATNNYAWVLCTSPLREVYDPRRGLEASHRLGDVDNLAPGTLDTVAACEAANGNFPRAVDLQTRAARELAAYDSPQAQQQRKGKEPGYLRRLDLYKAGKRYEELDRNE